MDDFKKWVKLFMGISMILLPSCSLQPAPSSNPTPLQFQAAIRVLAHHLFTQINNYQGLQEFPETQTTIVIDPFIDANNGEVIKASRAIEQILKDEGKKNFGKFTLVRLTPQTLKTARYLMDGVLLYEGLKGNHTAYEKRYYHIFSSVIEINTGKVIANSEIWIADTKLDDEAIIGSPMINVDAYLQNLVVTAQLPSGIQVDLDYLNSLNTNALLVEAETAYEKQEYDKARFLFSKTTERPEGQIMRTYAGLYRANLNLKDHEGAEEAFGKLVVVGVRDNNLSARFLFAVDSTQFIEDSELQQQYTMWLRQIGKYFDNSKLCLHIIGHASRTGNETYNRQLSQQRAQAIQNIMRSDFPKVVQRSRAVGKGFSHCKVCSGTDDSKDSVDRRVEFKVVDCSQLERD